MFCVASRPLAHPACPAAASADGSAQFPAPPQAQASAHAGFFSESEQQRMQAEADSHPLAATLDDMRRTLLSQEVPSDPLQFFRDFTAAQEAHIRDTLNQILARMR